MLEAWFPRSLDIEHGGFLCDFDRVWRSCGPHEKLLEFQARHSLFAAEASLVYPGDERLRQAALVGFRYLRDVMWDSAQGGWFHRLDRAGRPLEAHTKHAHGAAYAIQACVAVHEATGELGALDLARQGFQWLERFARDKEYGGYFGFLHRDGSPIRDEAECPWPAVVDTIGTPIGLKDANVHSDLLETFADLYRVGRDPKVEERLAEVVSLLTDRVVAPSGALYFLCQPDWTPVPHLTRFGYQFQTAHRLLMAGRVRGEAHRTTATARRLVDHGLRHGWDRRRGGVFYAGPGSLPVHLEGQDLVARRKSWWVQTEALRALLALSRLNGEDSTYREHFETQWRYVRRHLVDSRCRGIYPVGLDALPRWRRRWGGAFVPRSFTRKGSVWKDSSHEGRALLHWIAALRGDGREPRSPAVAVVQSRG